MIDSLERTIECLIIRSSEDVSFINADRDYQQESDPAVVIRFIQWGFQAIN
jgi:hypothetical protein